MPKDRLFWHYTTKALLEKIVQDELIKPAFANLEKGERPVVWFSAAPVWEQTANKGILQNGRIRRATDKEMKEKIGVARIGVTIEAAPYDWNGFKKLSGLSKKMIKALSESATDIGSNPRNWRVSLEPVGIDCWRIVQVWEDDQWLRRIQVQ